MLPKSCLLAAIDLGSNSFRLEIDQYKSGHLRRKAYLREPVRLGRGLDHNMQLSTQAMERGWAYLEKLGNHLRTCDVYKTRAIATQTLRQAENRQEFLKKAQALLGHPIEVISGQEEAILIYTGVCILLDHKIMRQGLTNTEKRLVIDIGGRSTEVITGAGLTPKIATSTVIGSVALSMQFFADGSLTKSQFDDAIAYTNSCLYEPLQALKQGHDNFPQWDKAYGASGTIGAISNILKKNNISNGTITSTGLEWIYDHLIKAGHIDYINLPGLGERKDVIGGGLSSIMALFSQIGNLHSLIPARGALRQGILYEMIKPYQKQHLQHE